VENVLLCLQPACSNVKVNTRLLQFRQLLLQSYKRISKQENLTPELQKH